MQYMFVNGQSMSQRFGKIDTFCGELLREENAVCNATFMALDEVKSTDTADTEP